MAIKLIIFKIYIFFIFTADLKQVFLVRYDVDLHSCCQTLDALNSKQLLSLNWSQSYRK